MTLQLLTNKRFISQSGGLLMTMTLMKHLCFGCSLSSFNAAKKHVSNSRKSFKTFLKVLLENVFIVIMAVLLPWSLQRQAYLMQAKHQQMIISKRARRPRGDQWKGNQFSVHSSIWCNQWLGTFRVGIVPFSDTNRLYKTSTKQRNWLVETAINTLTN